MITNETLKSQGLNVDVMLSNFRALYRTDATLAQQLDNLSDSDALTIAPAKKTGVPTAQVKLDDGRTISLHSRYDPQTEATKFVDRIDLDSNFVFIVSGFGLGYHIRELFDRTSSETVIIVLEPNIHVIRAAMATVDLSEEIAQRRLMVLHKLDKGLMHKKLTDHSATMTLGTELVVHPYTRDWNSDFHRRMRTFFTDYMAFCRMSFVTLLANCKITQTNVANNLWAYHAFPAIDTLRQRFAGTPAIVVSAGPSLAKNVELLKQAKGKAIIIAVQTTLKPLLNLGIEPDFVTALDYHEASCRFYRGIEDFGNIHLVAEPKVNFNVIDMFTGKVSLLKNDFADLCLRSETNPHDALRAGSTVAHLAFYLAEYIGADPIAFIGQDLGFTDNMYYAPGTAIHDIWSVELNRFNTLEMKEWQRIMRHRPILQKIDDINGRKIYTDDQMFTYLQQFERDFANSKATVIDATEGGARKLGAVVMPLAEVLDKYATTPIDPEKFDYLKNDTWFNADALPAVVEQLKNRLDELDEFARFSRHTVDLLKQLLDLLDQPEKFNQLMVKIDEVRSVVNAHTKTLQMVCAVSALAELRRFRNDRMNRAANTEGKDRAKRQLARDIEYIEATLQGCDDLQAVLTEALARAEHASETRGRP